MNKGVVLTVSISAMLAAGMLATVPMASAVQEANRLAAMMHADASSKPKAPISQAPAVSRKVSSIEPAPMRKPN